jgi:hypothetical protein
MSAFPEDAAPLEVRVYDGGGVPRSACNAARIAPYDGQVACDTAYVMDNQIHSD